MPAARRKRVTGVIALTLVPLTVAVGIAWAAATDNMFPTGNTTGSCVTGMNAYNTCQTDNAAVTYYMDSGGEYELEAVDKEVVRATMASQFAPTDLSISYDSSPVFSGSGETDIVYQEGSTGLSDSIDGMAWCDAKGSGVYGCDQHYVRIRGNGYYDRSMVCHETGHAVGLQHGDLSSPTLARNDPRLGCMKTPSGGTTTLGASNVENINATY